MSNLPQIHCNATCRVFDVALTLFTPTCSYPVADSHSDGTFRVIFSYELREWLPRYQCLQHCSSWKFAQKLLWACLFRAGSIMAKECDKKSAFPIQLRCFCVDVNGCPGSFEALGKFLKSAVHVVHELSGIPTSMSALVTFSLQHFYSFYCLPQIVLCMSNRNFKIWLLDFSSAFLLHLVKP